MEKNPNSRQIFDFLLLMNQLAWSHYKICPKVGDDKEGESVLLIIWQLPSL